jgi:hypothetical protein
LHEETVPPVLMKKNTEILVTYANKIDIQAGTLAVYHSSLMRYDKFATGLISYLKKEYRIE